MDLERGADQFVDIIDLRAFQEGQGGLVDNDFGTVALDHHIVRIDGGIEIELVGKAGATAAFDTDAEQRARGLGGEDGVDLFGR